jgi:hypothetical protein
MLARVNQHPQIHQLAILSIGLAAFFHPAPDPALTLYTVNLFWLLTFHPFSFGVFFFQP